MNTLAVDLGSAIHRLLREPSLFPGFRDQFRPQERDAAAVARNLNAAFLIAITGKRLSHPARGYLSSMSASEEWGTTAGFYLQALGRIEEELAGPGLDEITGAASELIRHLDTSPDMSDDQVLGKFQRFFFPEGPYLFRRHNMKAAPAEAVNGVRIEDPAGHCVRVLTSPSRLPVTASSLCLALTAAGMFTPGSGEDSHSGEDLVRVGTARLGQAMNDLGDTGTD